MLQAGEQALLVYAYAEAEQRFRTALELAQQLGDSDAASVATEQLGAALAWQSRHDEAIAVLQPAIAEAERRGDLARLARLAWKFSAFAALVPGANAEWVARLLRLIEMAQSRGPSADLAQLYLSLAYCYG